MLLLRRRRILSSPRHVDHSGGGTSCATARAVLDVLSAPSQEAIAALPQGMVAADTVGSFLHDLCMVCHEAFGLGDEYMGMTCSHTFHKVLLSNGCKK
jgi:hypothetical protein